MNFGIIGDIHCKDCNKKYRVYQMWSFDNGQDIVKKDRKREICKENAKKEAEKDGLELIEYIDSESFQCPKGHKLSLEEDIIEKNGS